MKTVPGINFSKIVQNSGRNEVQSDTFRLQPNCGSLLLSHSDLPSIERAATPSRSHRTTPTASRQKLKSSLPKLKSQGSLLSDSRAGSARPSVFERHDSNVKVKPGVVVRPQVRHYAQP